MTRYAEQYAITIAVMGCRVNGPGETDRGRPRPLVRPELRQPETPQRRTGRVQVRRNPRQIASGTRRPHRTPVAGDRLSSLATLCRRESPIDMPESSRPLRLGTRSSPLARWQAEWVAAALSELGTPVEVRLHLDRRRPKAGRLDRGHRHAGRLHERAAKQLLDERIDLAVHSLKDLPTDPVAGLTLAAVRCAARSATCSSRGRIPSFDALPIAATVGAGSARRRASTLARPPRPQAARRPRQRRRAAAKSGRGQYDAIILAEAGLERLGLGAHPATAAAVAKSSSGGSGRARRLGAPSTTPPPSRN